jgi:hypothetical protein
MVGIFLVIFFTNSSEHDDQGDPIWRIFAHWVIVYFEEFFITEVAQIFGLLFSAVKDVYYF